MKELLWTIQRETAFSALQITGVLRASECQLPPDDEFARAYDWMARQMHRRLCPPPAGVRRPIWAWYQWEGKREPRDLRLPGYAKRGTPMVQITIEATPGEFLLSDFDVWHLVLNNSYFAENREDWERFYGNGGNQNIPGIVASWDKVFDLTRYTPGWDTEPHRRTLQATLWEIRLSQVREVRHFIAK